MSQYSNNQLVPKFYVMLKQEEIVQAPKPKVAAPRPLIQDLPNIQIPVEEAKHKPEQRQLTKDEILVTQKFKRYEQKLLREYSKTVMKLELKKEKLDNPITPGLIGGNSGNHRINQVETNMGGTQNFLMSRLPLMDYGF